MQILAARLLCGFLLLSPIASVRAAPATTTLPEGFRVYEVNKRVRDFPETGDLSTPEAAYAAINRVMASGEDSKWRSISTRKNAERVPPANAPTRQVDPKTAALWLDARIVEVRMYRDKIAAVIAELGPESGRAPYDYRSLAFESGKWLNEGESRHATLPVARQAFAAECAKYVGLTKRPKIADPDAYLRPFVAFLKADAEEPHAFVMKALASHKVVIMGEIHHRPRYWAFNSALVADPDFPRHVGAIFMEMPSNDQALIDKFLAADKLDTAPVIEMLRDVLWPGWPDQAMLDFFVTVWKTNQRLPANQKLRIVCADMQRPWSKIQKQSDWAAYDVDRDRFMADSVLNDLRKHPGEKRNALFAVGAGHTMLNFKYFDGTPLASAGYYLREELGDGVFAFLQHTCSETNGGQVFGRVCLGLFESAFKAVNQKPMAFSLKTGPFGREPFDAFPDKPVISNYGDGYDAYLYLGPLEDESFSPLIPGFYTDEFFKEIERRYTVSFGKTWSKAYKQEPNAAAFIKWMSHSWGRPRLPWSAMALGPVDAWKYGSEWEKELRQQAFDRAREHPEVVMQAARKLLEDIRTADYEKYTRESGSWEEFPIPGRYMTYTDWPSLVKWICTHLRKNPIQKIEVGKAFAGKETPFTCHYKLTLKNGSVLENDLPMDYDVKEQTWFGKYGLDWHRKYKSGPPRPA